MGHPDNFRLSHEEHPGKMHPSGGQKPVGLPERSCCQSQKMGLIWSGIESRGAREQVILSWRRALV